MSKTIIMLSVIIKTQTIPKIKILNMIARTEAR